MTDRRRAPIERKDVDPDHFRIVLPPRDKPSRPSEPERPGSRPPQPQPPRPKESEEPVRAPRPRGRDKA